MSGLGFYAVKLAAIATISILFFVVLAVLSFFLGQLFPDNKNESIEMSIVYVVAYVGILTIAFYAARTQLKHVPNIFNGIQGFNADQLKEKDGSVLSGLALLLAASAFTDRAFRVRDYFLKKYN